MYFVFHLDKFLIPPFLSIQNGFAHYQKLQYNRYLCFFKATLSFIQTGFRQSYRQSKLKTWLPFIRRKSILFYKNGLVCFNIDGLRACIKACPNLPLGKEILLSLNRVTETDRWLEFPYLSPNAHGWKGKLFSASFLASIKKVSFKLKDKCFFCDLRVL